MRRAFCVYPHERSARVLICICRTVGQRDFSPGSDEGRLAATVTQAKFRDETLTDTYTDVCVSVSKRLIPKFCLSVVLL